MTQSDIPHWIHGQASDAESSQTFDSYDPYHRAVWAQAALGGVADVEAAVISARDAFDNGTWPSLGYEERGRLLHALAAAVEANVDALADADTTDMGRPFCMTAGTDVPRTASNFRFFADLARLAAAERFPMDSGHHAYTRYEPTGVVAAIAPWNFPLMQASWKIAPALAWGNTVVLKPAESSPASATIMARLATEVGFPDGVLNVVQGLGSESAGQFLTEAEGIDRITFTGESVTGSAIARAAATRLTPVSLELGGKGATVVFDDANLEESVEWAARAIFTNSGQICLCGSRIYVQRTMYDQFVSQFVDAAEALAVGNPRDPRVDLGPLASKAHFEKVSGYFDILEPGAEVLTGGVIEGEWAVRPTVVVGASQGSALCREEIFGPIAPIIPFDTEDEAIAMANDSRFGLSAMLFTDNLHRAHRVGAQLNAGNVWINCFYVRDLRSPFGGFGDSGIGREGGFYSREFFTEPKSVVAFIDGAR